ncbi:L,D-transpeptidase [Streptomyces pinistramenti]|uniref:L,D-transpeptidase n=1 Tax=Streptomyces pinistramenti TaxID=2884812 RepID=UPI001D078567|nr:Ig-like domain-containing protein [Streptomyces pinistramenti]
MEKRVMTDSKRRKGFIATAALLGGVVTLAACGTDAGGSSGAKHDTSHQVDEAAAKDASQAKIKIVPKDGSATAGISHDAKVTVSGGKLTGVTMTAVDSKKTVDGTLAADGRSWKPKKDLDRATKYTITAHAVDDGGRKAVENSTFTTVSPANSFIGNFTPEDGSTVGVGMPVSLRFDKPVKNKKDVESAIKVASSSNQKVVGHWFDDTRLDFRPQEYWKANSKVTMKLNLDGVEASSGVRGVQDKTVSFTVGRSQVSTVDANTHRMTVVRDGKTIRTIPISAGSADHPTYNGKMVISEKYKQTRMDGSTVGFTNNDGKGEYDIPDVPHAMRLSTSGTFIHGNYWGKGIFGSSNTSHGCIGLADAKGAGDPSTDGAWFFDHSLTGDIVHMVNSPDKTIQPDNGLNGWNMSWQQWAAGSALNGSAGS